MVIDFKVLVQSFSARKMPMSVEESGAVLSQNSCRDWNLTHDIGTKISTHLASHPATLGLMLSVPKNFSLMLLRFIDGTAQNS